MGSSIALASAAFSSGDDFEHGFHTHIMQGTQGCHAHRLVRVAEGLGQGRELDGVGVGLGRAARSHVSEGVDGE